MLIYLSNGPNTNLPANAPTACLHDIHVWMELPLESNRTELLLIGTQTTLLKSSISSITLGEDIQVANQKSWPNTRQHPLIIHSHQFFSLSNCIFAAEEYLQTVLHPAPFTEILVNSLVTSLDHWNVFLSGILFQSSSLTNFNSSKKNLCSKNYHPKSSQHITLVLRQFQWL